MTIGMNVLGIAAISLAAEWNFPHPDHAEADTDLSSLRAHPGWAAAIQRMRANDVARGARNTAF